ncbi:DNA-binding response regulator [candidate division BRC1 bacterium HGW-BRC1-1]|jgi:DNA-binding response OmpR family regulator|nr:MAG: DNA-binding response regulator [candidate division BRC1 bacterium HGW-BRC1-1]
MRLLLVEDSRRLRESLIAGLRRLGFALDTASDGEEGLRLARLHDYDVIILDLMLPKIDGLTILRTLRDEGKQSPILILTAKDAVPDRVVGLDAGADDYLTKPFAFNELVARLQALTRRKYGVAVSAVTLDDLVIDLAARRVHREGGEEILMAAREYALLEYFVLRRDKIVTRHQIEEALYDGRLDNPSSNVVDSAVCILRRAIDVEGRPSLIQTRRGLGYVLAATGLVERDEDTITPTDEKNRR